ncbi:hypothetical protein CK203_019480 [Vitis vinifera]|uniref:C2 domain-containing protein n=1 Tax=Vitis vinifera TaxID=29760 RepID=A0A438IZ41_VITVI|nr:hypothetical protein CK203_019480 [Vitis vinifera]
MVRPFSPLFFPYCPFHGWSLRARADYLLAKDLKNVNWRHGSLKPYVVVWVDPAAKLSTKVDNDGDTFPCWNETLLIPVPSRIEDSTLYLDVVHFKADDEDDTKPVVGSARLFLRDVVDDVGFGAQAIRTLELRRPSGRPHGKVEVKVSVRDPRYPAPGQPAYGQPQPRYGDPAYGQGPYAQGPYGQTVVEQPQKKSGMGMGTGLAVGAVAGVLGGLAISEGVDALEDHIADDVEDRIDGDDLGDYDGDDF